MDGCLAQSTLVLKIDAQVMLLKNLDPANKVVNGSRGVIIGFQPAAAVPDVRSAPPVIGLPMTAVAAAVNKEANSTAAAYSNSQAVDSPDYADQFGDERDSTPTGLYPLVRFANGIERLCTPEEWSVEQGGKITAQRVQVPLKLAWAISIHKSQGMTLDRVELELSSVFEPGHAYVALSRAVSLEATRLLSFDPIKVRAHPAVLEFYRRLDAADGAAGTHKVTSSNTLTDSGLGDSSGAGPAPGLSEEQKARIAASKAAALERAAAKRAEREAMATAGQAHV